MRYPDFFIFFLTLTKVVNILIIGSDARSLNNLSGIFGRIRGYVTRDGRGTSMKEFVEYIVKHLVDNPEDVKVSEVFGETTVVYELKVAQPDMGKVIGKNGRTAHAIRVLLSAVARKAGKHATLEILE